MLERFQYAEQLIGFLRCEHAGGFIKDQNTGIAVQRF